jgi:hypothetical protein
MSGSAKKNELLAADFFKITHSTNKENSSSSTQKNPVSNVINNNPIRNLFGDITRNVNHHSDNRQNISSLSLLGSASKTPVQCYSTAKKNNSSQLNNRIHFASNFNKSVQDQFTRAFEAEDENEENVGTTTEVIQSSDMRVPVVQSNSSLVSLSEVNLSDSSISEETVVLMGNNLSNVALTTSVVLPLVADETAVNSPSVSSANDSSPTTSIFALSTMDIETTSTSTGKLL